MSELSFPNAVPVQRVTYYSVSAALRAAAEARGAVDIGFERLKTVEAANPGMGFVVDFYA